VLGEWIITKERLLLSEVVKDVNLQKSEEGLPEGFAEKYHLTLRETEVAQLIADRKTYKEMGDTLFVSLPTIKSHCSSIYSKTGVKNKAGLYSLLRDFDFTL